MDKDQAARMLKEIIKIGRESSMTGSLSGGSNSLVSTYSKLLSISKQNQWIDDNDLFEITLGNDSDENMEAVAVMAGLLSSYLNESETKKLFKQ